MWGWGYLLYQLLSLPSLYISERGCRNNLRDWASSSPIDLECCMSKFGIMSGIESGFILLGGETAISLVWRGSLLYFFYNGWISLIIGCQVWSCGYFYGCTSDCCIPSAEKYFEFIFAQGVGCFQKYYIRHIAKIGFLPFLPIKFRTHQRLLCSLKNIFRIFSIKDNPSNMVCSFSIIRPSFFSRIVDKQIISIL